MAAFKIGELVVSTRGHDMGDEFIVYSVVSPDYVLLVDGKRRLISKPKLKKIKHLLSLGEVNQEFAGNIKRNVLILDAHIQKILKNFKKD